MGSFNKKYIKIITKLSFLTFNKEIVLDEKYNKLIKEAYKLLESPHITENYKNNLLYSMGDFNAAQNKEVFDQGAEKILKENMLNNIQLNVNQKDFYNKLSSNKNTTFSLPTSFGKSFLIREYIKAFHHKKNIYIIVPSLALMNEYTTELEKDGLKVKNWINGDKKAIPVLVQDRLIGQKFLDGDILIVDEAYEAKFKNERSIKTTKIIKEALENKAIIKLISPNIKKPKKIIPEKLVNQYEFESFVSGKSLSTRFFSFSKNILEEIVKKYQENQSVIIFTSKKNMFSFAHDILREIDSDCNIFTDTLVGLFDNFYTTNLYYWYFLKKGIAIHNGETPKPLRALQEYLFKKGKIKIIIANTTITQGINLNADYLFISSQQKKAPFNDFTFRNLIGRVGRYSEDINKRVGRVIINDNGNLKNKLTDFIKNIDEPLKEIPDKDSKSIVAKMMKEDLLFGDGKKEIEMFCYQLESEKVDNFKRVINDNKKLFISLINRDVKNPDKIFFDKAKNMLIKAHSESHSENKFACMTRTINWNLEKWYLNKDPIRLTILALKNKDNSKSDKDRMSNFTEKYLSIIKYIDYIEYQVIKPIATFLSFALPDDGDEEFKNMLRKRKIPLSFATFNKKIKTSEEQLVFINEIEKIFEDF